MAVRQAAACTGRWISWRPLVRTSDPCLPTGRHRITHRINMDPGPTWHQPQPQGSIIRLVSANIPLGNDWIHNYAVMREDNWLNWRQQTGQDSLKCVCAHKGVSNTVNVFWNGSSFIIAILLSPLTPKIQWILPVCTKNNLSLILVSLQKEQDAVRVAGFAIKEGVPLHKVEEKITLFKSIHCKQKGVLGKSKILKKPTGIQIYAIEFRDGVFRIKI